MNKIIAAVITLAGLFVFRQEAIFAQQAAGQAQPAVSVDSKEFQDYIEIIREVDGLEKEEVELANKTAEAEARYQTAHAAELKVLGKLWDELEKAALSKSGDPVADYAEARKLQVELEAAKKKTKAASDELYEETNGLKAQLDKVRHLLRNNWIAIAREKVAEMIDCPLKKGSYSSTVDALVRDLEYKFVLAAKAKTPTDKELQAAAQEYEKAYLEVESKQAAETQAKAAHEKVFAKEPFLNKADSDFYEDAKKLFAKPIDAASAEAYRKLQATGRRLVELRAEQTRSGDLRHQAYEDLKPAKAAYEKAFRRAVLSR